LKEKTLKPANSSKVQPKSPLLIWLKLN